MVDEFNDDLHCLALRKGFSATDRNRSYVCVCECVCVRACVRACVCVCVCVLVYFLRLFLSEFYFIVYWCGNYKALQAEPFFLLSFLGKIMTLKNCF